MKVKELIEILKKFPSDFDITVTTEFMNEPVKALGANCISFNNRLNINIYGWIK